MRGNDAVAGSLFSYVDLEKRMCPDHPLRVIRGLVNSALAWGSCTTGISGFSA